MNLNSIISKVDKIINTKPEICIILGSGLNNFCNKLKNKTKISFNDINNFKKKSVVGHNGEFIFGYLNKTPILCASGRLHYYEGYTFNQVGIIVRLFNHYKPKQYIITNSSGTVRKKWSIGDFMLTERIIDFSFRESNKPLYYSINNRYINAIQNIKFNNINLRIGTYTYTMGPTYETKEEIKEIAKIGGDIVGMSTFPEYLMCKKLNIKPIILSCITNYGAGINKDSINHSHVIKNAQRSKSNFNIILIKIIEKLN